MPNPIKLKTSVERVAAFGVDSYLVTLLPERPIPKFRPGQFLHLTIDDYDPLGGFWPESRVFSIASSPREETLTIIYSVKGKYTRRMEEGLHQDRCVWVKMPYGEFFIDDTTASNEPLVLIAGGTGISPYLAYLKQLASEEKRAESKWLYYGVRDPSYIVSPDLLERCVKEKKINCTICLESGEESIYGMFTGNVKKGQLDIQSIYEETRRLGAPVYCLSGPPAMIDAFKLKLIEFCVPESNIRIDQWE